MAAIRSRLWFLMGILILALFMIILPGELRAQQEEPLVRVALLEDAPMVSFQVSGSYELVNQATGNLIALPRSGENWEVRTAGGLLRVSRNGEAIGSFGGPVLVREGRRQLTFQGAGGARAERSVGQGVSVVAADDRIAVLPQDTPSVAVADSRGMQTVVLGNENNVLAIQLNGSLRNFRGNLEIFARGERLLAVNELKMEQYLYGVVPAEMPSTWPQASLRAQAVAARTYALRNIRHPVNKDFHVYRTQSSQVYQGLDWERPSSNQAVDATRGQVMLFQGQPIGAFYHSSSGGHTENSEDVWREPLAYIKAKEDPYDRNTRHYDWRVDYTVGELINRLAERKYHFQSIDDIEVLEMTASGQRVKRMRITGTGLDGKPHMVEISNADQVRMALGLKSALFELVKGMNPESGKLERVEITGHGWGHGLGMSQYGAQGMAERGFNHLEILRYYYTGVDIRSVYGW